MIRAARFLRGYLRPASSPVREEEVMVPVGGGEVEATLYAPRGRRRTPGWIVLHGVTVPGRKHESLLRFARAMAASGAAVLVPDVPEWRALHVRSRTARETMAAAADYLSARPETVPGALGVVGFSFGATHALIGSAHPSLRDRIHSVVGFGGYCDLHRVVRCMFTGEHEWAGAAHALDPDPYGRLILAANYLVGVPGMEGMGAVADAARELAAEAGRRRAFALEAEYDALKDELSRGFSAEERAVWELLVPRTGQLPADLDAARALAASLAESALAVDPDLDPARAFPALRARVVLAHGQADRLVTYTETLRLREALPKHLDASVTITRLFAHSTGNAAVRVLEYGAEGFRFVRLLRRALRTR